MNVVDSSCWLEYFADSPRAEHFAGVIEDTENLVVPSITLLEVFKRILQQREEDSAFRAIAHMQQAEVVDLDSSLALAAAKLGHELKMPLADSVILATAQMAEATLWTQDEHFKGIKGVKYFARGKA